MSTWEQILTFYQDMYPIRREGEMWEQISSHCQRMPTLISEIQKHPDLGELKHEISVVELSLSNSTTRRGALIFVESHDTVRVTFYNFGESNNPDTDVHASFDDIIQVLKTNLLNP
jgi:hypothetical protein